MNVRDRYFSELYRKTNEGYDIIIVSSDMGAPSLDKFRRDFPQRFVNVGIAEQNSIAVAAGLSMSGKIAITYGLNPFPVTRGFDHIRNIMAGMRIPITVSALKVGTCTAEAGFSHMALETISLLRSLHNISIINPSDETISELVVEQIIENHQPRFVQFDPFISGILYKKDEIDFRKGFIVSGNEYRVAIVTYGIWAHILKKNGIQAKIIDCFSLPIDKVQFVNEVKRCRKIITIEDGVEAGGIGSMVLEMLNDFSVTVPVKRMSLKFKEGYPRVFTDRESIFETEKITIDELDREIMEN